MDVLIPIVIVAVFYLGPILLKYLTATVEKNSRQGVPAVKKREDVVVKDKKEVRYRDDHVTMQMAHGGSKGPSLLKAQPESSPWNDKLDHNMLINGVIFAEILQPPRAYRPFGKKMK